VNKFELSRVGMNIKVREGGLDGGGGWIRAPMMLYGGRRGEDEIYFFE